MFVLIIGSKELFVNEFNNFSVSGDENMAKLLVGINDFAALKPELAKEWNYEKNGDLKPTDVTCGSGKRVWWKCSKCGHEWKTLIFIRSRGSECPKCANITRTRNMILVHKFPGINESLQDKKPELASEWNYEKNGELSPDKVKCGSDKKVWWRCQKCGFEWRARINDRNHGFGCPECGRNHRLIRFYLPKSGESLLEKNPELAKEWNYKRNGDLTPDKIKFNSIRKVWWKCHVCGYEWQSSIYNRNHGNNCSECTGEVDGVNSK